jgi:hypothetical protein
MAVLMSIHPIGAKKARMTPCSALTYLCPRWGGRKNGMFLKFMDHQNKHN